MLTIPEVAAACRISNTSVRRAIAEGELEAIKLRSRIRITREAFDAWLASQERPATRPKPPRPSLPRPTASRPKKPAKVFPPPGSFRELSRAGRKQDVA
jgi:excisionase family DNA binding protein